jgi:hypothetical protein
MILLYLCEYIFIIIKYLIYFKYLYNIRLINIYEFKVKIKFIE